MISITTPYSSFFPIPLGGDGAAKQRNSERDVGRKFPKEGVPNPAPAILP